MLPAHEPTGAAPLSMGCFLSASLPPSQVLYMKELNACPGPAYILASSWLGCRSLHGSLALHFLQAVRCLTSPRSCPCHRESRSTLTDCIDSPLSCLEDELQVPRLLLQLRRWEAQGIVGSLGSFSRQGSWITGSVFPPLPTHHTGHQSNPGNWWRNRGL